MARERTLQALILGLAERGGDPAIIAFGPGGPETVTYAELEDIALRLAGGLLADGAEPGEPIAIFAPNRLEWVLVRAGLMAMGALTVHIDSDLDDEPLEGQLKDSRATRIFTTGDRVDRVRRAGGKDLRLYRLDPEGEADGGNGGLPWHGLKGDRPSSLPEPDEDAVTALYYTSGTTGPPKAVPLTHRNIRGNLDAILEQKLITRGDRALLPLPLHHSYPYIVGMLTPLACGATMVLPAGVSGPEMRQALVEGEVTAIVGVPRLYESLYDGVVRNVTSGGLFATAIFRSLQALSMVLLRRFDIRAGRWLLRPIHKRLAPKLRLLASGGAKLDAEVSRRLEGLGWEVLSGYGLVETASIATFNPRGGARHGSAGLPAPGMELRLDQPDEQGRGEILLRGPAVFEGYRNNPEANEAAFTGDGWFRTGDLGVRDADGYIYIVGRRKEMIILPDGKNVAPEEVEGVYSQSPYAQEVAVLERDNRLVALVVPDLDAAKEAGGRVDDLIRISFGELAGRLPAYKRISDFVITRESLPRTNLGKYRRFELDAIYDRAERGEPPPAPELSDEDRALIDHPKAGRVWEWLQERFPERRISPDTSPQLDLGIDSLAWVHLGMELEEKAGIRLSEDAIARAVTVRDLLEEVEAAPETRAPRARRESIRKRIMDEGENWLAEPGTAARTAGWLLHWVARTIARAFFRIDVRGRDKVPRSGPLIVAANHVSDLDPLILGAALSHDHMRSAYWGADAERVFGRAPLRALARILHLFPVDDRAPGASLDVAAKVLERERILIWFPEEWRSPTGRLQRFRPGIGRLIARSGARVVPAYIDGTFAAMPRNRRLPRPHPVTVTFGDPVAASDLGAGREDEKQDERIAERLRDIMADLEPDEKAEPREAA